MLRRIRVQGCSGSGKTTLAHDLAARLDLPHLELDAVNHREGWREATDDEWDRSLEEFLVAAPQGWVSCGNYSHRSDRLAAAADTVVWLDYPRSLVMARMVRRTFLRAALRRELWNGNRERWRSLLNRDPADNILLWAWTMHPVYADRFAPQWEEHRAEGSEPRWVRLRSPRETRAWVAAISPR